MATVAFRTEQNARHVGRTTGYVNSVLSIRVGEAVGSCATEPDAQDTTRLSGLTGSTVDELLDHPEPAVRTAALDAYLAHLSPHDARRDSRTARLPRGDSSAKSRARARAVVDLLPEGTKGPVAVIGVVNSLLSALEARNLEHVPCDFKGGRTEQGETVLRNHSAALSGARAVLASGMTLGNGTFDGIAEHCRANAVPLVVFAQTGSAVFRELLGTHLTALSAEPYPFFWLTGQENEIHLYPAAPGGHS
nr:MULTISPECIES: DUF364 domain-containing protein [unclassified Actinopolyspora]